MKPALDCDLIRIEIAYRMVNEEFLESLVTSRASPEPLRDILKYELSAQLRNTEGLTLGFSEIEIEEFPVTARVHIRKALNIGVPEYIKRLFVLESKLLNERNPYLGTEIMVMSHKP